MPYSFKEVFIRFHNLQIKIFLDQVNSSDLEKKTKISVFLVKIQRVTLLCTYYIKYRGGMGRGVVGEGAFYLIKY